MRISLAKIELIKGFIIHAKPPIPLYLCARHVPWAVFFNKADLPEDIELWDAILLKALALRMPDKLMGWAARHP